KPQMDMSVRLDEILNSGGLLARLCELVNQTKQAVYFAEVADLEQQADSICEFSPNLVPGLLQIEGYARAVFEAWMPWGPEEEIEDGIRARMERARLLENSAKPRLWFILHEFALQLPIGGHEVMRAQCQHIAKLIRDKKAIVQVVPSVAGAHALMEGPIFLMTFEDAPPVAYVEGVFTGNLLDDPALVARAQTAYDLVRAAALSPQESLVAIERWAEEWQ
ncbi:DUF5753 domain-containing protein, partial [Uniformispora flossi]|uniref:DUF5753 domain-containing protein n=1 Tax=Uniformispora flossi TaxID=3390723 RepID=UPI003D03DABF